MIAEVEDAIIAAIKASSLVTPTPFVRKVDSLPNGLDIEELAKRRRDVPGIFVAFLGGPARKEMTATIDAKWGVFALAGNQAGELPRRRGDATAIGAYQMLEVAIPAVHGLIVAGIGTLKLEDVSNLYSGELEKVGLTLYSALFEIPIMLPPPSTDSLAPFEKFFADWDLENEHANTVLPVDDPTKEAAADLVELPQ